MSERLNRRFKMRNAKFKITEFTNNNLLRFIIIYSKSLQLQMMNQTEILKVRAGPENSCMSNIQSSSFSNQLSGVTIIKANTYQSIRDKTPKAQILTKTNSSNKLIRVSSSKGINVVSIRPSSTQKQVRQFNSTNNISLGGSSQTTIKMEQSHLIQQMRQELKRTIQRYQQKMNQQLSYQHNYFIVQIERLRQLLILNQGKLSKHQFQIQQLLKRVETVQRKIEAKTNSMSRQLSQFKKFYEQCHTYTLKRINQAEQTIKVLCNSIDQTTSTLETVQTWKYVQYVNNLTKNIILSTYAHTSSLKYQLDDQIYQLQLKIGRYQQQYDELDKLVYEMRNVNFGNDSLRQCIKQLGKFGINTYNFRKDNYKENILQYYEPKFKEIIKRVNNSTIQVDLVRALLKNQNESYYKKTVLQQQKISELQKIIQTLRRKIDEDKIWYTHQLADKQELVSKSNPRILELQTRLHSYFQQQAQMMKQISQLNLKVSFYQTKCEKNTERQFGIQSTLAEAFSETIVKQKIKIFLEEKRVLQQKIGDLSEKIKKLDNQNYLLAQKLSQTQESRQQNIKLQAQLKFVSKMLQKNEQGSKKLLQEEKKHRLQKEKIQKQCQQRVRSIQLQKEIQHKYLEQQIKKYQSEIGQMQKQIQEWKNKTQQYENKILNMVKQRNNASEDDDQYFQQLQEQVQKNYKQIQKLQNMNRQLAAKNKQLIQKNQELQDDLHNYAETFEKQSITFRTALQNLQKQKDYLAIELKKIGQDNKILKMDLEQTRTAQSFYEQNNTVFSMQLRKTVSTDLSEQKTSSSPSKKLQKKPIVLSTSKPRPKYTHPSIKTSRLRIILERLKYELPVVCQLDGSGYLKDQRTGCYFIDQGDNYFYLDQQQLAYAVKIGLIVL